MVYNKLNSNFNRLHNMSKTPSKRKKKITSIIFVSFRGAESNRFAIEYLDQEERDQISRSAPAGFFHGLHKVPQIISHCVRERVSLHAYESKLPKALYEYSFKESLPTIYRRKKYSALSVSAPVLTSIFR